VQSATADGEVELGFQTLSLRCPIAHTRIKTPCRSSKCTHPQCFDAQNWFSFTQEANRSCPICDKPIENSDLVIDEYFEDILKRTSATTYKVVFGVDGEWHIKDSRRESSGQAASTVYSLVQPKEKEPCTTPRGRDANQVIGVELPIIVGSTDSLAQSIEIQFQPPLLGNPRDSTYKEPDGTTLNPIPVPDAPMRVPAAHLSRRAHIDERLNLPITLAENANNSNRQEPTGLTTNAMPPQGDNVRVSVETLLHLPQHPPEPSYLAPSPPIILAQQPPSPPPYTDAPAFNQGQRIDDLENNVAWQPPQHASSNRTSCFSFIYNYSILFNIIEGSIATWLSVTLTRNHDYFNPALGARIRLVCFTSWWSIVFLVFMPACLLEGAGFPIVLYALTMILWTGGAASITQLLKADVCSSLFPNCSALRAMEAFAWIIWILWFVGGIQALVVADS
ncbi:SUMO ligase siz1, partial [Ceratobasidium sp. 414]